jgi:hypothetical protein
MQDAICRIWSGFQSTKHGAWGGGGLLLLPYLSVPDAIRHMAMVVKLVHNSLALYVRDPDLMSKPFFCKEQ